MEVRSSKMVSRSDAKINAKLAEKANMEEMFFGDLCAREWAFTHCLFSLANLL